MSIAVSGVISSLFVIMAVEAWMKGHPPTRIHLGHNRSRHVHNHAPGARNDAEDREAARTTEGPNPAGSWKQPPGTSLGKTEKGAAPVRKGGPLPRLWT